MLKGNLSTRPFYNERLVNLLLILLAAAGIALAVFNTTRTIYLTGEQARRTVVQRNAEQEIARLREEAAKQTATVDKPLLLRLGAATAEANAIIDQRLFSWTVLLGLLEQTIPFDVRLMTIAPRVDRNDFVIEMAANARNAADIQEFIENLLSTGYFYETLAVQVDAIDADGTLTANIETRYRAPRAAEPKAEAKVKANGGRP
jgi:hypothetical protein